MGVVGQLTGRIAMRNLAIVLLIACPTSCTSSATVTGLAHIRLTAVQNVGSPKFVSMTAVCTDTCGDGRCTSGRELRELHWRECSGCPASCP
jgi:hypothetical protein